MVLLYIVALVALVLNGAIFGFFYAWVCSTMWGLDMADPHVAIAAMQAMNATVRNAVFAPAFFGTPIVALLAMLMSVRHGQPRSAMLFGGAAFLYLVGGLFLTLAVNVPMNEALASMAVPAGDSEARAAWLAYSAPWQFWNTVRTVVSGVSLTLVAIGLLSLGRPRHVRSNLARA